MEKRTSDRHAKILGDYLEDDSHYRGWTKANLGDIEMIDWSWGFVNLVWNMDDRLIMPDGVVFGGHIASVGDHLVSLGAMTVLTQNKERFRTAKLEVNFFRPLTKCNAEINVNVINASKNLIHVEADIFNVHNKLAARINAVQMRRMTGE